jgi:hypothetical protein
MIELIEKFRGRILGKCPPGKLAVLAFNLFSWRLFAIKT